MEETETAATASPDEIEEAPDSPPEEETTEGETIEKDAADTVESKEEAKQDEASDDQPMMAEADVVASEGMTPDAENVADTESDTGMGTRGTE